MSCSAETTGDRIPLLPEQRRFLEEDFPHDHFNVALLLSVHPPLEASICEAALRTVISRHSGLHVGLLSNSNNQLGQIGPTTIRVERIDLTECLDTQLSAAIESVAGRLQTSIKLTEPPLIRAAYFSTGEGRPDRLLFIVHHFVVDGLSAHVLVRDFIAACDGLMRGVQPTPVTRGVSATEWARELLRLAHSGHLDDEVDIWCRTAERVDPFPVDNLAAVNTQASIDLARASFTPLQTKRLFRAMARVHGTMHEVLAAGLLAVAQQSYGMTSLRMTLVSEGRRGLIPGANLSRTIGWIATRHPVTLHRSSSAEDIVTSASQQLQRSPHGGASYNVLRYLSPRKSVVSRLAELGEPEIEVNYQGGLSPERLFRPRGQARDLPTQALFEPALEPIGPSVTNKGCRREQHQVVGTVMGGQLIVHWHFSENLHRLETIQTLVERLVTTVDRWAQSIDR